MPPQSRLRLLALMPWCLEQGKGEGGGGGGGDQSIFLAYVKLIHQSICIGAFFFVFVCFSSSWEPIHVPRGDKISTFKPTNLQGSVHPLQDVALRVSSLPLFVSGCSSPPHAFILYCHLSPSNLSPSESFPSVTVLVHLLPLILAMRPAYFQLCFAAKFILFHELLSFILIFRMFLSIDIYAVLSVWQIAW